MKIRTPGSQLFIQTLTAMGATVTPSLEPRHFRRAAGHSRRDRGLGVHQHRHEGLQSCSRMSPAPSTSSAPAGLHLHPGVGQDPRGVPRDHSRRVRRARSRWSRSARGTSERSRRNSSPTASSSTRWTRRPSSRSHQEHLRHLLALTPGIYDRLQGGAGEDQGEAVARAASTEG